MKDEPVLEIVNRAVFDEHADVIRDVVQPIHSLVNAGSTVFTWMERATSHRSVLSPCMLFRRCLSLGDGIELMVTQGATESSIPLLRSLFETSLSIEHCLASHTRLRCLAYQLDHVLKRQKLYRSFVGGTDENKRWETAVENDEMECPEIDAYADRERVEAALQKLGESLARNPLKKTLGDWNKLRGEIGNRIKWYSLYSKLETPPSSIEKLADSLGKSMRYEIFYRQWSGSVHGQDVFSQLLPGPDEKMQFAPIRYPADIQHVVTMTCNMLLETMRLIAMHYCDTHKRTELANFYNAHIKNSLMQVANETMISID